MFRRNSINFALLSLALDGGATVVALALAEYLRPILPPVPWLVPLTEVQLPLEVYILAPIIWVGVLVFASAYDPRRNYRFVDEFQVVTLGIGLAALIFMGLLYIGFRDVSRWLIAIFLVFNVILLFSWRLLARWLFRVFQTSPQERRVLIIGSGEIGQKVVELTQSLAANGLAVVGFIGSQEHEQLPGVPVSGKLNDIHQIVTDHLVDDVIIALPQQEYDSLNRLVWMLHDLPVNVRIVPDYFSLALYRATAEDFAGLPMINLRDPALNEVQRLVKRFLDFIVALLVLSLLSPLMLLISFLTKLDSRGPILFHQDRVGENGHIFKMHKFRTMVPGADHQRKEILGRNEKGELIYKRSDDPRVTRVGRVLRRTSLDELPQLLNVIKGDMSLVGPRPELPWLVETYQPWQMKRFAVPQGMTGWWQINGRSDKPMHLHTEDDLYYIQNYSLWMDIYILLKTPWVVIRGKGAY